jgi:hypothetical protein
MNFRTNLVVGAAAGAALVVLGAMSRINIDILLWGEKLSFDLGMVTVWMGAAVTLLFLAMLVMWDRAEKGRPRSN